MSSETAHILVVDDEPNILLSLERQLASRGYRISTATGGKAAVAMVRQQPPDLLILDLMMPDIGGLEIIRTLRNELHLDTPIVVLSARGDEQQKVEALDLGADDYLTKPFGLDELLARVRVALRHRPGSTPPAPTPSDTIGNAQLTFDLTHHRVLRDGQEIKLTPKQYDLLKYLALNPDRLITHSMLLRNVWGPQYGQENQYLHVYIGQLRHKIEPNPAKPRYILTEPGLGYRFILPE